MSYVSWKPSSTERKLTWNVFTRSLLTALQANGEHLWIQHCLLWKETFCEPHFNTWISDLTSVISSLLAAQGLWPILFCGCKLSLYVPPCFYVLNPFTCLVENSPSWSCFTPPLFWGEAALRKIYLHPCLLISPVIQLACICNVCL